MQFTLILCKIILLCERLFSNLSQQLLISNVGPNVLSNAADSKRSQDQKIIDGTSIPYTKQGSYAKQNKTKTLVSWLRMFCLIIICQYETAIKGDTLWNFSEKKVSQLLSIFLCHGLSYLDKIKVNLIDWNVRNLYQLIRINFVETCLATSILLEVWQCMPLSHSERGICYITRLAKTVNWQRHKPYRYHGLLALSIFRVYWF